MTFNQLKLAIYSTFITNWYGLKLRKLHSLREKKVLRAEYCAGLLESLNIEVKVINPEKMPKDGNYLLASNHRTIIDPLIVETATQFLPIQGYWISKKELYNSFFFGLFVRNAGTLLIDRESAGMGAFFKEIKQRVKEGDSIYIFPEGTRNKSEESLGEFKDGTQLIALKNRLDILPVYIRNRADLILSEAIADSSVRRVVEFEIGDLISYKDRSEPLRDKYKKIFNIT